MWVCLGVLGGHWARLTGPWQVVCFVFGSCLCCSCLCRVGRVFLHIGHVRFSRVKNICLVGSNSWLVAASSWVSYLEDMIFMSAKQRCSNATGSQSAQLLFIKKRANDDIVGITPPRPPSNKLRDDSLSAKKSSSAKPVVNSVAKLVK